MKLFVPILLLALASQFTCFGTIWVVLRCDDYAGLDPTEFDRRLVELCRTHRTALTLGVVPFLSNEAMNPANQHFTRLGTNSVALLAPLVASGLLEVAQHGYSHQTRSIEFTSEFEGMPLAEQTQKIAAGKKLLEDVFSKPVATFIPPWNRFDAGTVRALEACGFETISVGKSSPQIPSGKLRVLPSTCELSELRRAVSSARQATGSSVIVAIFHGYDFREVSQRGTMTYVELDRLLGWLKDQPSVKTVTISELTRAEQDLSAERFSGNVRAWALARWLPERLVPGRNLLYSSILGVSRIVATNLFALILYASVTVAAGLLAARLGVGLLLKTKLPFLSRPALVCTFAILATALVVAYGCRHRTGTARELTLVASGFGIALGTSAAWASVRRDTAGVPDKDHA